MSGNAEVQAEHRVLRLHQGLVNNLVSEKRRLRLPVRYRIRLPTVAKKYKPHQTNTSETGNTQCRDLPSVRNYLKLQANGCGSDVAILFSSNN